MQIKVGIDMQLNNKVHFIIGKFKSVDVIYSQGLSFSIPFVRFDASDWIQFCFSCLLCITENTTCHKTYLADEYKSSIIYIKHALCLCTHLYTT